MKYTILGFSQKKLVQLDLDIIDAALLRYFVDFKDSGKMFSEIFDNEKFYWIKYEEIIKEMPILKLNKSDTVYRRLKNMVNTGVLIHRTKKQGGTYSFYALGPQYIKLLSDLNESEINPDHTDKNPEGYGNKSEECTDKNPEGYGNKSRTKNPSIKDYSTKDPSIKDMYIEIIDYLNLKTKLNYKASSKDTQKHINARISEGYTIEDFKKVIDKKVREWKGTEYEQYLRPSTLFGTKFEGYLNQKVNKPIPGNPNSTFNNFAQRDYDFENLENKLFESQEKQTATTAPTESKLDSKAYMESLRKKALEGEN